MIPSNWEAGPAGQLAIAFVLEVANISRADADALDILILTAALQANQALIHQVWAGDVASGRPLPDELRRPISINALAESLRLPFETTRRRVATLIQAGLCVPVARGLIVPEAVVTAPWYVERQQARVAALGRLFRRLEIAGFVSHHAGVAAVLEANVRVADRVIGAYMLRACDRLMRLAGDAQAGLVLLALWEAAPKGPATGAQIAAAIGAPHETVRRRLHGLQGRALAVRTTEGWCPTWPAGSEANVAALRAESLADLRRMHAELASRSSERSKPAAAGAAEVPGDR